MPRSEAADRAEPGLEVQTFASSLDERTLAAALAAYADQPVPISRELEDLWEAHGLRMISIPTKEAERLARKLQTDGSTQKQWLGQAYAWTEAVRGNDSPGGRIVALDAERIRLTPGMLRLLVRSWVEPVPPEPAVGAVSEGGASSAPGAVLRVEMVPQHREARSADEKDNPFTVEPKIDAESQGLLFSRLYARMGLVSGRALLVIPARPGVNWKSLVAEASEKEGSPRPEPASTRDHAEWGKVTRGEGTEGSAEAAKQSQAPTGHAAGPARVGEVVRGEPRVSAPQSQTEPPVEPSALDDVRVPTLGEAMLARPTVRADGHTPGPPQRTIVLLIPHVPREFHLLAAPAGAATPRAAP